MAQRCKKKRKIKSYFLSLLFSSEFVPFCSIKNNPALQCFSSARCYGSSNVPNTAGALWLSIPTKGTVSFSVDGHRLYSPCSLSICWRQFNSSVQYLAPLSKTTFHLRHVYPTFSYGEKYLNGKKKGSLQKDVIKAHM